MTKRPLPFIDKDIEPFWHAGRDGHLLIQTCTVCDYLIHPPTGYCPECGSRETAFRAVSGHATVLSFTVNHKAWMPDLTVPYVVALVSLDEQEDVRLATNIVDCDPEAVHIGMPVEVLFEQQDDVWIPLFRPKGTGV